MISPDAFTGAVLAAEGLRDGAVLMNGPTGCKFHHGALCEVLHPRGGSLDPLRSADRFYFGQQRVPCTYLEGDDYVDGTAEKLEAALPAVLSKGHSLITIINSPGAALIGDDVRRIIARSHPEIPVAIVESCAFSQDLGQGFQDCLMAMLEALPPEPIRSPSDVNLVGVSIMDHGWERGTKDLKALLALCDVKVGAVLCAGCTAQELSTSRSSTLNVVMDAGMGGKVADHLRKSAGVVRVSPEQPIGFQGTARWVCAVCDALSKDPSPALAAIHEEESRCAFQLARYCSLTGLPKGATFSLHARPSVAQGLLEFLHGYLGMVPVSVECPGLDHTEVRSYLSRHGLLNTLGTPLFDQPANVMLGDGNDISIARSMLSMSGIEIAPPYNSVVRIRGSSLWGVNGAVDLLDDILSLLGDRW